MPHSHERLWTIVTIFRNVSDPQPVFFVARQCFVSYFHKSQEFSDDSLAGVIRLDFQFRPLALPKCHRALKPASRSPLWLLGHNLSFFPHSILLLMSLSTFKIFVVWLENLSATSKLHWRQQLLMKAGILKKADSYFLQAWRFPSVGERKVSHKWKSVKETPPTTSCWGKTRFDMMYSAVRGESERWESNRYVYADWLNGKSSDSAAAQSQQTLQSAAGITTVIDCKHSQLSL